jgi:hypothetical protein
MARNDTRRVTSFALIAAAVAFIAAMALLVVPASALGG